MKKHWSEWVWDAWCIASIIGIWPRYIEPELLKIKRLSFPISDLPTELIGLKVLHFSDLHWSSNFSESLQRKLVAKAQALKPDLILFTGDFLCRSKLENPEGLCKLLNSLPAKWGCFAVPGNHDYSSYLTVNAKGDYDLEELSSSSDISKGFKFLFQGVPLTRRVSEQASQVKRHEELFDLLKKTPFHLLENETLCIRCKGSWINICGVEEYSAGKINSEAAFKNYDRRYPGIVLSHNPDSFEILRNYPGDIILSGHTHGGQVNLPLLWKRLTLMENPTLKRGLKIFGSKRMYINRGISSVMKFRWFAAPELTLVTFQKKHVPG